VNGVVEYIEGEGPIGEASYVRSRVARKEKVELALVEKESEDDMFVEDLPDYV
jgi:hypothetical protein